MTNSANSWLGEVVRRRDTCAAQLSRLRTTSPNQELAELVISSTGSRSEIVRRPLPQDDPAHRQPDISLTVEKLGWQPVVPLKEGLARTGPPRPRPHRTSTVARQSYRA